MTRPAMDVEALSDPQATEHALDRATAVLQEGGVIVAPTETVYGILTRWDNPEGRRRIYAMKVRAENRPLQMLARDVETIYAAGVERSAALDAIAGSFWPGPLTILCRTTDGGSIAARIPAESFTRALLSRIGRPLAASSANRSGQPTPTTAVEAAASLTAAPDLVVESQTSLTAEASTILSLLEYDPEILRQGTIHRDEIIASLRRHGLRK